MQEKKQTESGQSEKCTLEPYNCFARS